MSLPELLREIEDRGVTLISAGEKLRFKPKRNLTPELIEELRTYKTAILGVLAAREELEHNPNPPRIDSVGGVLEMARRIFGVIEDPVILPDPTARDPMAQRVEGKVKFFRGDWRRAWPEDFTVYRPDGVA